MSTDVDPETLDSVAGTLRNASSDLDGSAGAPAAPQVGAASGAVAALLAFLADEAASISEGVGGAGDAVAAGGQSYLETDDGQAENFN
jgi:hypothetical protein